MIHSVITSPFLIFLISLNNFLVGFEKTVLWKGGSSVFLCVLFFYSLSNI